MNHWRTVTPLKAISALNEFIHVLNLKHKIDVIYLHKTLNIETRLFVVLTYMLARSPDDPQRITVASVFELSVCLLDCLSVLCRQIFSFFSSSSYFIVVSYVLLARSPDDPQRIRVASVFELSVCLIVCLFFVGKFSNSSPHPPLSY